MQKMGGLDKSDRPESPGRCICLEDGDAPDTNVASANYGWAGFY